MDALSDLLRVLHFSGGVFLDATFRTPWCVHSQVGREDCTPGTPHAALVAFHYVLDGQVRISIRDSEPRSCNAGDLIVVVRNDVHLFGSDLSLPPMRAEALIRAGSAEELALIDAGSGDKLLSRFVCGYLGTPVQNHPLLDALPDLLVTSMRGRPCAEWVESSFRFAARMHAARQPGAQDMLARLSELLFVEAVREYIEQLPPEATSWLAALRDPPLARALSAMHARVAHAWTTEQLAEEALLSRSAFAERFVRTLGVPPMTYLTRWRMLAAAQRLRESRASIGQVAAEVGYESESTFTRAFAREMGVTPGVYRRGGAGAEQADGAKQALFGNGASTG
jgi:AraC-like DNA-binding protein